jgi:hypothetical protein
MKSELYLRTVDMCPLLLCADAWAARMCPGSVGTCVCWHTYVSQLFHSFQAAHAACDILHDITLHLIDPHI